MGRQAGFSLIELILVLLLVGILAVTAATRWRGDVLTLDAAAGRLMQDIRHARALAMSAEAVHTLLNTGPASYETRDSGGNPVSAQPNPVSLEGISLSAFSLSFDSRGRPGAADTDIDLSRGSETVTLRIAGETGAVRRL